MRRENNLGPNLKELKHLMIREKENEFTKETENERSR